MYMPIKPRVSRTRELLRRSKGPTQKTKPTLKRSDWFGAQYPIMDLARKKGIAIDKYKTDLGNLSVDGAPYIYRALKCSKKQAFLAEVGRIMTDMFCMGQRDRIEGRKSPTQDEALVIAIRTAKQNVDKWYGE